MKTTECFVALSGNSDAIAGKVNDAIRAQEKEEKTVHLTEQHVIDQRDPRYALIDKVAFGSKNLYNAGNYAVRQAFFADGTYLNYHEMQRRMQSHEAYKALPTKVSQHVLMQLAHDWESFFKARAAYAEDPSKFLGRP